MRRVGRFVMMAATLSLVAAGCGGAHHSAIPPTPTSLAPVSAASVVTTTTVAATTTTTEDPTHAAILAAYRAEWTDFNEVDTFPVHPLDPRLSMHAIGQQLIGVRQALTRLSLLGHYDQGSVDLAPVVTELDGDSATIMDCLFDHSVEVDGRTNVPIEAPNAGHTVDMFKMSRVNGAWYVSDSTILKSGKAVDACTPSEG